MPSFRKQLKKKISNKIFFSALTIFVIFTVLILFGVFFSLKNDIKSISQAKIINKGTKTVLAASSSASIPTKKEPTQESNPVFSGNQLKVPVLYYHYVGNNPNPKDTQRDALSISPDKFNEQMKYLKDNGYTTISYDTLDAALRRQTSLPNKPVILTFDDGYIDFYVNAYNILKQYGLSATVFIPTGLVGQPAYLTWPMIQEMHSSGLISFGAHTVHHVHLTSISSDTAFQELQKSKQDLQDHLGVNINFMAYPYGETNSSVVSLVQKAGYIGAIGTWSNKIQSEGTIYNSPRLRISGSIDTASFAALLQ